MKLTSLVLFLSIGQRAFSADPSFDLQISSARNLTLSGNYVDAMATVTKTRAGVASLSVMPQDLGAIKASGFNGSASATTDMVLNALSSASSKYAQNDQKGAVQALDLAQVALAGLSVSESPTQRLAFSVASLQQAIASKASARVLQTYLHRTAKDAYAAGHFDESLGYANEIVTGKVTGSVVGPYFHWAHTIAGLDHLAKGETELAVAELNLSAQSFPAPGTYAPSMALAKALLPTQRQAVMDYLNAAANYQNWPGRSQAAVWKAQVQAGQTPNFGGLATMGM